MQGYKEPGFQDRMKAAQQERTKALARLKAAPAVDPAFAAERAARALDREAVQAEKRARAKAARETRQAAKAAPPAVVEPSETEPAPAAPTEQERKAIRDARYAARKARRK
jgi:hypothetical protein